MLDITHVIPTMQNLIIFTLKDVKIGQNRRKEP